MIPVVVQTVPESPFLPYLRARIPHLIEVADTKRDPWDCFIRSMEAFGSSPGIHLEDDIILTRNFLEKAAAVIDMYPTALIQFFSMRKDDLTVGSRWDRSYLMLQCTYFPQQYGPLVVRYAANWTPRFNGHPNGYDAMVRDFLRARREPYFISVPSLVQHRNQKSRLGSRSSKRQSLTFTDPDGSDPWLA